MGEGGTTEKVTQTSKINVIDTRFSGKCHSLTVELRDTGSRLP